MVCQSEVVQFVLSGCTNDVFLDALTQDEGDVNMVEAMKAYARVGFDGVMQPDHTPTVSLPAGSEAASWHVGTAFALGYMKAAATAAGVPFETIEEIRQAEAVEQQRIQRQQSDSEKHRPETQTTGSGARL